MPQSKSRKKRIADHQKRLERARRKLERKHAKSFSESLNVTLEEKENDVLEQGCRVVEARFAESGEDRSLFNGTTGYGTDGKTSWNGFSNISNLYSWCHSGIASVSVTANPQLMLPLPPLVICSVGQSHRASWPTLCLYLTSLGSPQYLWFYH